MSKVMKTALIVAAAVVLIAAKQYGSNAADRPVVALSAGSSISTDELMRDAAPLRETQIDSLF